MSSLRAASTRGSTIAAGLALSRRRFLTFLRRRGLSEEAAEDVLHEAFVRGLERGGALREDESATAWFDRVLRNAVVDHHRRNGASSRALARWAHEPSHDAIQDPRAEHAICQCLGPLAAALKPEYAEALRAVDLEGTPIAEYASTQGIAPNNARVRLFRAREALRREVAATCQSGGAHACADCTCGD